MKAMAGRKLSFSQAADPFIGFSFAEIVEIVRTIQSPRSCPNHRRKHSYYSQPADDCSLESCIDPVLKSLENRMNGLLLEDFSMVS